MSNIQRAVNQRLVVTNFVNLCDVTLKLFNCSCKAPSKNEKYHRVGCASNKNTRISAKAKVARKAVEILVRKEK